MTDGLRIAFVGNALPRRCGIATFTCDLELAMRHLPEVTQTAIIAMCDPGGQYAFPPQVRWSVAQDDRGGYLAAADFINAQGFDVVCLQHEFGIYGGEAGEYILDLIAALDAPLVSTLHTVLDAPSAAQRRVIDGIIAASARIVVMARKGRRILIDQYGADPAKILVIPHGIPEVPLVLPQYAKEKLGFAHHRIILTFGLISPNKGIETMIEAMLVVLATVPDALYVVMGATHPSLIRSTGEAYRESLRAKVTALGLDGHVVFIDRFVERPELLDHIAMCDVYVTPYLVESQMTSGTLAYSHGLGRPVVSTPYWHAAELLEDGSGLLVPFGDPDRLGLAVADLLLNDEVRLAMGRKAYVASRAMTWANTAARYGQAFLDVRRPVAFTLPPVALEHLGVMCDDTGLFQHAVFAVPDRHHGYCIDDNARALLLCCTLAPTSATRPLIDKLRPRFAAFLQHGWNPDNGRFRNFLGYDRRWLEEMGSQDSHGRTLWALGRCARYREDGVMAQWASALFASALLAIATFTSPRAWAFTLLGLADYCLAHPRDATAMHRRLDLGERLHQCLLACETADWVWFEDRLTYDNARLCEALIITGRSVGRDDWTQAGLRALRWLIELQTAPAGYFRPVGSHGFLLVSRTAPMPFDQQPIEACATVAACLAAMPFDASRPWLAEAHKAFAWFTGANDLGLSLIDSLEGSCRDGLHPDRANENRGAESLLAYLLALADMEQANPAHRPMQPAPVMLMSSPIQNLSF